MSPTPIRDPNLPGDPAELREIPDHQHIPDALHPHNPVPTAPADVAPPDEVPPVDEVALPIEPPPAPGHNPPGTGKPPGTPGGGPKKK